MTDRNEYIAGLRKFADWLEANPQVKYPYMERMLLPLMVNDAVTAFAAEHGLDVQTDDEGNMSCQLTFGPVIYYAYGYADFKQHCENNRERAARKWAADNGIELSEPTSTAVSA